MRSSPTRRSSIEKSQYSAPPALPPLRRATFAVSDANTAARSAKVISGTTTCFVAVLRGSRTVSVTSRRSDGKNSGQKTSNVS